MKRKLDDKLFFIPTIIGIIVYLLLLVVSSISFGINLELLQNFPIILFVAFIIVLFFVAYGVLLNEIDKEHHKMDKAIEDLAEKLESDIKKH